MTKTILKAALALGPALFAAQGCNYASHDLDPTVKGFFDEDSAEARKSTQFADAQAASGARAEGMLYDLHFDGPRLNSLGEKKLSLMLEDDDGIDPMVVYLDLNEKDARAPHRRDAIAVFLRDKGLRDDQVMVVYGDNPAARTPAARHIVRQPRTESGENITGNEGSVGGSTSNSAGGFYSPSSSGTTFGTGKK